MELNFITTNKGKIAWLKREFLALGIDITIKSPFVQLIEPQADTVSEVSISKVKQAYQKLKAPAVVEDGGFFLPALAGFPGVYSKYINQTIKNEGILCLLKNKDRTAYFISATSFYDGKILKTFECRNEGRVPHKESSNSSSAAWSDLWKIFIPNGYNKTLADLDEAELKKYQMEHAKKYSS